MRATWIRCTGAHDARTGSCPSCAPYWGSYPACVDCTDNGRPRKLRVGTRRLVGTCPSCKQRFDTSTKKAA